MRETIAGGQRPPDCGTQTFRRNNLEELRNWGNSPCQIRNSPAVVDRRLFLARFLFRTQVFRLAAYLFLSRNSCMKSASNWTPSIGMAL